MRRGGGGWEWHNDVIITIAGPLPWRQRHESRPMAFTVRVLRPAVHFSAEIQEIFLDKRWSGSEEGRETEV